MLFIQYKHFTTRRIPFSGNEQTDDGSDVVVRCTCIIILFTILVVAVTVVIVIGNYSTASHTHCLSMEMDLNETFEFAAQNKNPISNSPNSGSENQLKIFD